MKTLIEDYPKGLLPNVMYGQEHTLLDELSRSIGMKIVTIKLECPKCGHSYGVKLDNYDNYVDVPDFKFVCMECAAKNYRNGAKDERERQTA